MTVVNDLIEQSLRDGVITDHEAARIVQAHNQLQHKSREELKSFLAQYGISAVDYGMKTVDVKRIGRSAIPERLSPTATKPITEKKKSNFFRKRNAIFAAITTPAIIVSALGLILL